MIIETALCLDDGIVETPTEADMGLIMGVGFPPFRGGALKYADTVGMKTILDKCAKYAHLGKLYEPTESMKKMAAERSEEHTSELQSLMRISYAVFCLKKKNKKKTMQHDHKHMNA